MSSTRTALAVAVAVILCSAALAEPPAPPPMPPSAWVFNNYYRFINGTDTFTSTITIPQDGAWIYGTARYANNSWMDCDHHYEADIAPVSSDYQPFFKLGYVDGLDTPCTFSNACFSCAVNFGGVKARDYYTTNQGPAFLATGTYISTLRTLNGGGGSSVSNPDAVSLYLSQVNVSEMSSMTVFEALRNDFPAPVSPDEKNSRAYIAVSDDKVPLVPQFTRGEETFPGSPGMSFTAKWDTGDIAGVQVTTPNVRPGNLVLLIDIPRMKTGNHKVTVTATLPSGITFTAAPYQVFIYNVALEASVAGGAPVLTAPVTFTRGQNVKFKVMQQDTSGKTITVTRADWTFRPTIGGDEVKSVDETGFPVNSKEWGGTMHQGGLVFVNLTIKTGKYSRTSNKALAMLSVAQARTGPLWQTSRTLCEDCFDDLGIKNGGVLNYALVFPSHQNVLSDANFPANGAGGITTGITGEKKMYENGLKDDITGAVIVEPRTVLKALPLHRPHSAMNDPADEWNARYEVEKIATGPNRGFWYVKSQSYKTTFAWAYSAYFKATGPGANPANYKTWAPVSGCGAPNSVACYATQVIACWGTRWPGQSYHSVATTELNPNTGQPYQIASLLASTAAHEKRVHWQKGVLDFIVAKPEFDIARYMEAVTSRIADEATLREALDSQVRSRNVQYAQDPAGGGYEETETPIAIPIVEDLPLGTATCNLIPSN